VLRKAPCPVLTIPPKSATQSSVRYRQIVCATDFSPASRVALDYALSLAQADDARLCLLYVNEWPVYPPTWYESAVKTDALREAVLNSARAELARAVPDSAREWCRIEERVVTGRPHEEIVGVAGELQADLIVMGVHGRAVLTHAIFGSTTNQVVRHATCPVLSVRK
jgi:nucleotide-binding universal stress UspA family protein